MARTYPSPVSPKCTPGRSIHRFEISEFDAIGPDKKSSLFPSSFIFTFQSSKKVCQLKYFAKNDFSNGVQLLNIISHKQVSREKLKSQVFTSFRIQLLDDLSSVLLNSFKEINSRHSTQVTTCIGCDIFYELVNFVAKYLPNDKLRK